jgi:DNA-binding protein YbaB
MGVFDMAKMAQKAMQARKKMSKVKAAGKSGFLAVLIDGLYTVTDVEVDKNELRAELDGLDDKTIDKIATLVEKNVKNVFNDAKKSLEKELASSSSMEELKGLLS